MMKRWWVLALLLTLALSLTSCSSKKKQLTASDNFGFNFCDGTLGNYDVYVIPAGNGLYDLSVIPVQVQPGDIVSIGVINSSSLQFREVVPQVAVNPDTEIYAGHVTQQELFAFDKIAIVVYTPGVSFLERDGNFITVCDLPLPGDLIGNTTAAK